MGEVEGEGCAILPAEEHVLPADGVLPAQPRHRLLQEIHPRRVVVQGERFAELVPRPVARQGRMLPLGVVDRDAQDFLRAARLFEQFAMNGFAGWRMLKGTVRGCGGLNEFAPTSSRASGGRAAGPGAPTDLERLFYKGDYDG